MKTTTHDMHPKLTKLLVNVTIQRSLGPVKLVLPLDVTVEELTAAVLRQYVKEMRLPILSSVDPSAFDLHYSRFSLESLNREEKLMNLGSRNFFLCLNSSAAADSRSVCSKDVGRKGGSLWLKFLA